MKKLYSRYLNYSYKNSLKLAGVFLLITILGIWGTLNLKLSTNLSKLLPSDTPSVKTANEASRRVGSTDFLVIAIESPDPSLNKKAADEMGRLMKKEMKELNEVVVKLDLDFFKKNGLLYFSNKKLALIDAQLKKVLGRAKLKSMGLLVLPDEKDPEEIKLENLIKKSSIPAEVPTELKNNSKKPAELKGYISSPDGKILAVLGRPAKLAVNMKFARRLVNKSRELIAKVKKKYPDKNLKIDVGGGYRNRVVEYDSILKDVVSSFGISFLLISLLVVLFFRSFRPLPLIFIPLLSGIFVTLGITRMVQLKELNIITAFIGGILLGMGIDFGVHLTARYMEERGDGKNLHDALTSTMMNTGRALTTAAFTTAGALYLLFFSSFRGFWEFGIIAGTGILVTLFIFLLFFPVVAIGLEKLVSLKSKGFVPFKLNFKVSNRFPAISVGIILLVLISTVLLVFFELPKLKFEDNFRRISGNPSTKIKYGKAMGDNSSPTLAMCENAQDCAIFDTYLKKITNRPLLDPNIRDFLAITSFLPENQDKKMVYIKSMNRRLKKAFSWADEKTKKKFEKIKRYIPEKKVTVSSLPKWIRKRFSEKNGTIGRFIYLYPRRETWNGQEAGLLKKHYGEFDLKKVPGAPKNAGVVRAASSSFILVDIIKIVKKEGILIFIAAFIMVFIFLLLDFRSFTSSFMVFLPLVTGLLWTASLIPLLGQRLGLYNMVVLSTIVGAGIDGAVHLYHSIREHGVNPKMAIVRSGMAVSVASLTTMVGFSGMMMAKHGGLSSIGRLATIGMMSTLITSILIVPSLYFISRWFANPDK